MKRDITKAISELSKRRAIFHSEDDFKFALSQELLKSLGDDFDIRLERPVKIQMPYKKEVKNKQYKEVNAPIDIIIINKKTAKQIPIELKYKTKAFTISSQNEQYNLKEQSARDIGRYSFRKDIFRLETFLETYTNNIQGFFIVITNDLNYKKTTNNIDKNYNFEDGITLAKIDNGWDTQAQWITKDSELTYQLNLKNEYKIQWNHYSKIENEEFIVSIVEINKVGK